MSTGIQTLSHVKNSWETIRNFSFVQLSEQCSINPRHGGVEGYALVRKIMNFNFGADEFQGPIAAVTVVARSSRHRAIR